MVKIVPEIFLSHFKCIIYFNGPSKGNESEYWNVSVGFAKEFSVTQFVTLLHRYCIYYRLNHYCSTGDETKLRMDYLWMTRARKYKSTVRTGDWARNTVSEFMVDIWVQELRNFLGGYSNVEDTIFVSTDRLESYTMSKRQHPMKKIKNIDKNF